MVSAGFVLTLKMEEKKHLKWLKQSKNQGLNNKKVNVGLFHSILVIWVRGFFLENHDITSWHLSLLISYIMDSLLEDCVCALIWTAEWDWYVKTLLWQILVKPLVQTRSQENFISHDMAHVLNTYICQTAFTHTHTHTHSHTHNPKCRLSHQTFFIDIK